MNSLNRPVSSTAELLLEEYSEEEAWDCWSCYVINSYVQDTRGEDAAREVFMVLLETSIKYGHFEYMFDQMCTHMLTCCCRLHASIRSSTDSLYSYMLSLDGCAPMLAFMSSSEIDGKCDADDDGGHSDVGVDGADCML